MLLEATGKREVDHPGSDYRFYRGRFWRRGYTTGACAAAAAKAAVILLQGHDVARQVEIDSPAGKKLILPLCRRELLLGKALASVIKDGGDDPDVTSGLEIVVKARFIDFGIQLHGGQGVGRVTRPGLATPVGEAAINPVPRAMILKEVTKVLPPGKGVELTVEVPRGAEVAARTFNPILGIEGGISILGTTGIVEPMSEEAFRDSLVPQINIALATGHRSLLLTPGRTGQRQAVERYGFPATAVIQMGNFVGFMLENCSRLGVKQVLLFGSLGKIVKVAAGIFNTHSHVADGRLETLAVFAALKGARPEFLEKLLAANTTEEAVVLLFSRGYDAVFQELAARASNRASRYCHSTIQIGTAFTSRQGDIIGFDKNAAIIGEGLGCLSMLSV